MSIPKTQSNDVAPHANKRTIWILPVIIVFTLYFKLMFMVADNSGVTSILAPHKVVVRAIYIGIASSFFLASLFSSLTHLLFKNRNYAIITTAALSLAITVCAYVDLLFSRYSGFNLNYTQLALWREGIDACGALRTYMNSNDWIFFIDIPLIIVAAVIFKKLRQGLKLNYKIIWAVMFASVFYFFALISVMGARYYNGPYGTHFTDWDVSDLSRPYNRIKLTYPASWALNAVLAICPRSYWQLTAPPQSEKSLPQYDKGRKRLSAPSKIIFLQVESLGFGTVDWDYNGKPVMPCLRALAKRYAYFPHTFSPMARAGSFDADIAALTGFSPAPNATAYGYLFSHSPYLPHILKANGFETHTYANERADFYQYGTNHKKMGIDVFFETYNKPWETNVPLLRLNCPGDREFLSFAANKISMNQHPSFNFILTKTSHGPYGATAKNREVLRYSDIIHENDTILESYAIVLNYVDHSIKDMLATLKKHIEDGSLLLVIYGDHGVGIDVKAELPEGIPPQLLKNKIVPLIMVGRDLPVAGRIDTPIAIADLPSTICNLYGFRFNYGDLGGRDIFSSEPCDLITPDFIVSSSGISARNCTYEKPLEYGYGKLGAQK